MIYDYDVRGWWQKLDDKWWQAYVGVTYVKLILMTHKSKYRFKQNLRREKLEKLFILRHWTHIKFKVCSSSIPYQLDRSQK